MCNPNPGGKTLWEMFSDRLKKNGSNVSFYNPLDLRIESAVQVSKSRPDYTDFDFSVKEIREYTRRIGGQEFRFTDYVLQGINTKTFDNQDAITIRLRAVPNPAGSREVLLLRLDDEMAFDSGFLEVLNDPTGVFDVTDDHTGKTDHFTRINEVKEAFEAVVMIIAGTTESGMAPPGQITTAKLEYWDYWRDMPIADGSTTKKQFLFVEMNSDTGWFQIWLGEEFFI